MFDYTHALVRRPERNRRANEALEKLLHKVEKIGKELGMSLNHKKSVALHVEKDKTVTIKDLRIRKGEEVKRLRYTDGTEVKVVDLVK